jgi:hypothetical protein
MFAPFQRSRGDNRSLAHTQRTRFLRLLLKIFPRQSRELPGIFFFYDASFSVELLNVIQPRDATGHLSSSHQPPAPERIFSEGDILEAEVVQLRTQALTGLKPSCMQTSASHDINPRMVCVCLPSILPQS